MNKAGKMMDNLLVKGGRKEIVQINTWQLVDIKSLDDTKAPSWKKTVTGKCYIDPVITCKDIWARLCDEKLKFILQINIPWNLFRVQLLLSGGKKKKVWWHFISTLFCLLWFLKMPSTRTGWTRLRHRISIDLFCQIQVRNCTSPVLVFRDVKCECCLTAVPSQRTDNTSEILFAKVIFCLWFI